MPPLRRSLWLRRRCRPRHTSVCARRAAFARAPSSPLRLVRPLAPAGADGGAVGAQKAARPSRRVRCAPPVAACVRRSRAAAAVGRSAARSPLKRGLMWLVSPRSLPAAAPAPASVCAASSGGWGLLAPSGGCAAAAPPPPPPVKCWGRGLWLSCVRCGGVAPAAAGAKKRGCLPYLTAVFLLSHLVTQSAQDNRHTLRVGYKGVVVAKGQHRNILTR